MIERPLRRSRQRALIGAGVGARALRVVLLVAVDCLALTAACAAAYLLWARPVHHQPWQQYAGTLPALLPLFVLGYAMHGLYPGSGLGAVEGLRRLVLRTSFVFLVVAGVSFAFKLPHVYSRMTFAIAWMLSLVLVPLLRTGLAAVARVWDWWSEPVVIVGAGPMSRRTIRALRSARSLGYRPVAVLVPAAMGDAGRQSTVEDVVVAGVDSADGYARRGVQVAMVVDGNQLTRPNVAELSRLFRHLIHIPSYPALPVEGVTIRNLGGILGVEFNNRLLLRSNRLAKRLMDVVFGSIALLAALPVIGVAALSVRIFDGGPALFRHRREGLEGREIYVPKLRTMVCNAEKELAEHLRRHPEATEEWSHGAKLQNDPRLIPGLGRLLRRFSIDELPQLWLVVRGHMSLVGPRPFPDYHLADFSKEFLDLRRRVRPGVTGLWQVMARSRGGKAAQQALDTHYIRNWSLWMDVYILARTGWAVLLGRGAY